jgi:hypothetical protein
LAVSFAPREALQERQRTRIVLSAAAPAACGVPVTDVAAELGHSRKSLTLDTKRPRYRQFEQPVAATLGDPHQVMVRKPIEHMPFLAQDDLLDEHGVGERGLSRNKRKRQALAKLGVVWVWRLGSSARVSPA